MSLLLWIVAGYYSWRNTMRGSWFMQALCEEFDEHGFTLDILTLLTFVNRKVAVDYESNVPDNSVMHQQKQIPCITYMLTRILRFAPKDDSNEIVWSPVAKATKLVFICLIWFLIDDLIRDCFNWNVSITCSWNLKGLINRLFKWTILDKLLILKF